MGKRSRKQPRRNHPLAWLATAVLGLAALWLGVSPERLRSDPAQALEQIAPAIARAGSGTGTVATPEPAPSGQWPAFLTPEARQTVALIQRGVFFVPIATKQCSLSAAHSDADVQFTLEQFESAVASIW